MQDPVVWSGAAEVLGGGLEALGGAATIGYTGGLAAVAGGSVVVGHGLVHMSAGLTQMITRRPTQTFSAKALANAGVPEQYVGVADAVVGLATLNAANVGAAYKLGAVSGRAGGNLQAASESSVNFPSAQEIGKRLGVSEKVFHRMVKKNIEKDFSAELRALGAKNPDIGVNKAGNIVLKNPQTGKTVTLDVKLDAYKEI